MNKTSRANRRIMAILLVAAGLFMIAVASFLVQLTLDPMLEDLKEAAEDPRFASGPTLMAILYPLWRALIMVAGVACVVLALPTSKGEEGTWPASLALLAARKPLGWWFGSIAGLSIQSIVSNMEEKNHDE